MSQTKIVKTRFAPSPTGELHIGGIRTALYDYALARQNDGKFILRIEDTDQKRYVPGSENRIMEDLKAYNLIWDEDPYYQSQRADIYNKYIKELLDNDHAYYCFCTEERLKELKENQKKLKQIPKYDRHCLNLSPEEINKNLQSEVPYVIRMKIPKNETIIFNDLIRGQIKFNTNEIDDQVLIKSNGIPTYHFAAVVDDHLMEITHIFRGEEWLTSTPKHVLLYKYFNWEMPQIGHLSIFLAEGDQKGKMSKRQGSTQAREFLEEGYLPEAVLNFLMLLGWNPGTEQEIFSLEEFVKQFSVEKLNKKPVVFDRKKLAYFNGYYIRQKSDQELVELLKPFLPQTDESMLLYLAPLLKERITSLKDVVLMTKFLFDDPDYDKELLLQRGVSMELAIEMLENTRKLMSMQEQNFSNKTDVIQKDLLELINKHSWNTGQFFMVFRVAICGTPITPPVVECLPILGRDKTIHKLDIALSKLRS